jgi:uncharacterized protein
VKKLLVIIFFLSTAVLYSLDIPFLGGRVNDYANILSDGKKTQLDNLLKEYEKSSTNQIVVLTTPSLEGEDIEQYSIKVAETWKIGQKGKDNGVILVVAQKERKVRIEVGYGLEGVLTDLKAGRIVNNVITPEFKKGDFDAGVEKGLQTIIEVIGGNESSVAQDASETAQSASDGLDFLAIAVISLLVFSILGVFTFFAVVAPGFTGWFLYFFLYPFYIAFPISLYGTTAGAIVFFVYALSLPAVKYIFGKTAFGKNASKKFKKSGGGRPGVSSGGFFSSSSGFSSSSSSFSGGGGSFGGGGASGSW